MKTQVTPALKVQPEQIESLRRIVDTNYNKAPGHIVALRVQLGRVQLLLIAARMLGASSQKQNASFAEKFLCQLSSHATDQIESNQGQRQEEANSTLHEWLARKEFSQTQKERAKERAQKRQREEVQKSFAFYARGGQIGPLSL